MVTWAGARVLHRDYLPRGSSNLGTPACLLRATFVLFGHGPLVHEPSPSTLCACMFVCLNVLYKAYFVVIPSKPVAVVP